ncbi:unnamed protein product, partial [Staurois parvus]
MIVSTIILRLHRTSSMQFGATFELDILRPTYLMMVRDGVIFLCGIPRIQRTGTSLWWVPITGSI